MSDAYFFFIYLPIFFPMIFSILMISADQFFQCRTYRPIWTRLILSRQSRSSKRLFNSSMRPGEIVNRSHPHNSKITSTQRKIAPLPSCYNRIFSNNCKFPIRTWHRDPVKKIRKNRNLFLSSFAVDAVVALGVVVFVLLLIVDVLWPLLSLVELYIYCVL